MEPHTLSIIISIIAFVLILTIVLLCFSFKRKKNRLLNKQEEFGKNFHKELAKAKIEIHEAILNKVSWELHDNIGQLITLAKIQLQNDNKKEEVKQILDKVLGEVRGLSKLLNADSIKKMSFTEAIKEEINQFNRINYLKANFTITGEEKKLKNYDELIMFRILQEFFSNVIKHAGATTINVFLNYKHTELNILAEDNGCGFDPQNIKSKGIGLSNMRNRAKLIGAQYALKSQIGKGTTLELNYLYP
jgi:signal transduction histidine kinase